MRSKDFTIAGSICADMDGERNWGVMGIENTAVVPSRFAFWVMVNRGPSSINQTEPVSSCGYEIAGLTNENDCN